MHKVAKLFDAIFDAPLEKAVRFEIRVVALDIHVRSPEHGIALARGLVFFCGRIRPNYTEPAVRQE
jgi:hypothetical protein